VGVKGGCRKGLAVELRRRVMLAAVKLEACAGRAGAKSTAGGSP
jgi:hypothetical protein